MNQDKPSNIIKPPRFAGTAPKLIGAETQRKQHPLKEGMEVNIPGYGKFNVSKVRAGHIVTMIRTGDSD